MTVAQTAAPSAKTEGATEQTAAYGAVRHDWTRAQAEALFALPFNDLIYTAQTVHRIYFHPNAVQKAELLSIKTGGCPEDCGYCSQSAQFETGLKATKLMDVESVVAAAKAAKARGATRYCMGAAWRNPKDRDMPALTGMIREVKGLGLETCMTLGMLSAEQAGALADAGLDYYNHNIDTSEEYYDKVITTRTFADRIDTLEKVRASGMAVCCGGIVGMGEAEGDRVGMLVALANLPDHPGSVPINALIPQAGTPMGDAQAVHPIDFVKTIAAARVMMPASVVRLAAGREDMSDEMQALCFLAGVNSIFIGERLLTSANPGEDHDTTLMARLGLAAETPERGIRRE